MGILYERYRHSPSSGNCWIESPSSFLWRWGFENWGGDNARQAMGKAAEHGVYTGLIHNLSDDDIASAAMAEFDRLTAGEVTDERDASAAIAVQFAQVLRGFGPLLAYQPWRGVKVEGLEKEISMKPDFVFTHAMVDAKATLRCPSEPRWAHVRQQALYCTEWQLPALTLYATPKKRALYEINRQDVVKGAGELLSAFRQIELWDSRMPSPERAVDYIPLNLDSYHWSEPADRAKACELWGL